MGNYEQLKRAIANVIKTNGNQEITGAIMQSALLSIISTVGNNATFAGIATPDTNPGTPDQNVFYLAEKPGIYANFGGVELTDQVLIFTNKNGSWVKTDSGIATAAKVTELDNSLSYIIEKTKIEKIGCVDLDNYVIDKSTGNWFYYELYACQYMPMTGSKVILINNKSEKENVFAFLTDIPNPKNNTKPNYCEGTNQIVVLGKQFTYVNVPDDCKYIIYNYPEKSMGIREFDVYIIEITDIFKNETNDLSVVSINHCRNTQLFIDEKTQLWTKYINYSGKYLDVSSVSIVDITASNNGTMQFAFLKDIDNLSVGNMPNYCEGTELIKFNKSERKKITVPDDAKYLYFNYYVGQYRIPTIHANIDVSLYTKETSITHKKKIILDTDFGGDCDDLPALAILLQSQSDERIELISVICSTKREGVDSLGLPYNVAGAVDAVCRYYGYEIPIGVISNNTGISNYCGTLCKYSHKYNSNADAENDLSLYRSTLLNLEEKCDIVVTGTLLSLSALINSNENGITGIKLIRQKVNKIYIMGGKYPGGDYAETNFSMMSGNNKFCEATYNVLTNCPVPMYFVGFEQNDIQCGGGLYDKEINYTIVYNGLKAFLDYHLSTDYPSEGIETLEDAFHKKCFAWDPITVLCCINDNFDKCGFDIIQGTNYIDIETGINTFTEGKGTHFYVKKQAMHEPVWYQKKLESYLYEM